MNENMVNAGLPQEPEELELDLRDMLATLFLRWKTLLLCLLAGALAFALFTLRSAPRTTTVSPVTEADVFDARQAVSEERAEAVERLFRRVRFYTDYLTRLEEEYSSIAGYGENGAEPIMLKEIWLATSEIDNIGSYLSESPLSEEDYDRLRELTAAEGAVSDVYHLVSFGTFSGMEAWDGDVPYDSGERQYLFQITGYGASEQ